MTDWLMWAASKLPRPEVCDTIIAALAFCVLLWAIGEGIAWMVGL